MNESTIPTHSCHMDDIPCSNNPELDNQQSCRYWWNPLVIARCKELIVKAAGVDEHKTV